MYQIWLYTTAGVKTAYLQNAFNIQRSQKINQTPTLSFSFPADDTKSAFLTSAYEVKVWNTVKSRFEGLYTLDDATEVWGASGSVINVNYSGYLAQLSSEQNKSYDTTVTPKTPTQIITALLGLQEHVPAITVGTIQPTTSFAFAIENANLLEAILKCVSYLGGYIEVDANRALNWYNEPSGNPVREIRYQKNMKGVTRKQDFTKIANKIYAYGYGETEAQVTLIDAGETYEYIQNTASQLSYGIKTMRITDKRIIHPSTLLRWANLILSTYKDPVFYYTVDVVNLAEHSDFDYDYESLEIGQIVRVVNSDLNNLSVNVKLCAVDINLSKPENITVELANLTQDLADGFSDVKSYQNLAENVAVQIGAGQVTVQGTFTVDGWRSAGVTTIDGGQITANTITTTQLNFTPVTGGNVIATINASAEGIQISGARIAISGSTTFDSGYDPTSKTAKVGGTYDSAASGARVRIFPDSSTGIQITDGTNDVFKALVGGTDVGDVIIGDYAGGKGIKWDKSATTLYIAGTLQTSTLPTANTLTVVGAVQSTGFSVSPAAGWQLSGSAATFMDIDARGTVTTVGVDCSGTIAGNVVEADYRVSIFNTLADGSAPNGSIYSTNGLNLHWKDQAGNIRFFTFT